jgi:spore coat protein U-like protein
MTMRASTILVVLLLLVPASAHAQSTTTTDTRTFTVNGSVPGTCAVGPPTLAPGSQNNFRGLNGSTLQIDQLVDTTTLSTKAASIDVRFDSICTFPHRLMIESQNNGLWRTSERSSTPPEGFGYAVPYRALVRWARESLRLNADATIRRIADSSVFVRGSAIGDIELRLEIDSGSTNEAANAPLLAGVYGDTIRITLEPQ